jgi:hypothetical protein
MPEHPEGKTAKEQIEAVIGRPAADAQIIQAFDHGIGSLLWLGEVTWPFPLSRPVGRAFDAATDQDDFPLPEPLAPWKLDERRRMDLYLRVPATVVR